ncbi:hypothetical protein SELMODRAFT_16653, partial [Selaginella moellendorffii]
DVFLSNILIQMYGKHGSAENARLVFDRTYPKDKFSWNLMLAAYTRNGLLRDASDLFERMRDKDLVSPDEVSFICVFLACSHAGDVQSGWSIFVSMSMDFGIKPVRHHYSGMVDLLSRSGKLEDAEELIWTMPFVPGGLDWRSLLSGCRSYRDDERAAKASKQVMQIEPEHSASYILLSNMF